MPELINKKVTIYDIAMEVGTSAATVSRVLSNSGYPVKRELRDKIIKTAEKLNYRPNIIGRMLKTSRSNDIGVIIPTISNPFYPRLVLGIELEARKRGYNIFLCNSFRDAGTEKKYIENLYQKQVLGIIISSIDENNSFLSDMQKRGVNIVAFDQDVEGIECSKVGFDYVKGGIMAVEYLIKMGHRKIAFLSSPLTKGSRKKTLEGYKIALLKNGIEFENKRLVISELEKEFETEIYEFEVGKELANRFLLEEVDATAIFAVNDMTAFGIIKGLADKGIKVPGDISVIGFDNIEISSMLTPPLTTINQPAFETGKLACKLLIDIVENKSEKNISLNLEPDLVERESVSLLK